MVLLYKCQWFHLCEPWLSRALWDQHYKLIGTADTSKVVSEIFNVSKLKDANYPAANCGKLMTIKNVKLKVADGKAVLHRMTAPLF